MNVKPRSRYNGGTSHVEHRLPVSYDMAFRLAGPNERVIKPPKKVGRAIKYPDQAVRDVRALDKTCPATTITALLAPKYPGITATWVRQVLDGIIRANVK